MAEIEYRGRKAVQISNGLLTIVVVVDGGHIASVRHAAVDMNPLWTPHWPSVDPSRFDPAVHTGYGGDAESKLLAGVFGHNLCLDLFGGPSEEEAAAGMTVHGESSVALYEVEAASESSLVQEAEFAEAQLRFRRIIELDGDTVRVCEQVTNLSAWDRPAAWTQHVSLGAPFVEPGATEFAVSATRSKVFEEDFAGPNGVQRIGAEFDWPHCPTRDGGVIDLRVYPAATASAGYTAHLMDTSRETAHFAAWHPGSQLAFAYVWRRADFPWLGRWEENRSRLLPPWNGREITCGMEFGVSPMPETRRRMVERGSLFGVPSYRWLSARQTARAEYMIVARKVDRQAWTSSNWSNVS